MGKWFIITLLAMLTVLGGVLALMDGTEAQAADVAVVDTVRILNQSKAAQAGEKHLTQVQEVLQKGLDDLQKLYKGKEKTTAAQQAVLQGQASLERQLGLERQAVLAVLGQTLEQAVRQWRTSNSRYVLVISRQSLLDSADSVDVTEAVMKEMDKIQPQFPDLPTVTVSLPDAKEGPQKPEAEKQKPAPARQPARK